ncbi:hypothetical protein M988_4410 [Hafnia paralvei ATCC 29927]|uniref:hypothetical protein n=1 Tax=Hafnia paralvei TaxID=546367 RepID=UPI0007E4D702|nr:hypothetical protein [Hafnia paralvei]OAT35713.1 hypothetical protein M988_4410 [Hafnia paralvei ATCC 29927]
MTYEELTEQATVSITQFMDLAKSAEDKFLAELFRNAAWGATMLWRDLTGKMKQDPDCKVWDAINQQDEVFEKLIDRQSVPLLKDEEY